MHEPDKKLALVTGAAGALGRELVGQLIERGFDCVALDRNRRGLESMHDALAQSGPAPLIVPLDLAGAGPDNFEELAESLQRQFGRLDLMIHAAAHFKGLTPIEHCEPEEWMKTLQAGLTGPMLMSKTLLALMRGTPGSKMLWVLDHPDQRRTAYWGGYGVSQLGRVALADILAAECRRDGPEVCCVDPGRFHSPLRSRVWPAEDPAGLPTAANAAAHVIAAAIGPACK